MVRSSPLSVLFNVKIILSTQILLSSCLMTPPSSSQVLKFFTGSPPTTSRCRTRVCLGPRLPLTAVSSVYRLLRLSPPWTLSVRQSGRTGCDPRPYAHGVNVILSPFCKRRNMKSQEQTFLYCIYCHGSSLPTVLLIHPIMNIERIFPRSVHRKICR